MITYQLEQWSSYYPDCLPLWREHYDEFRPFHKGRLVFGPDIEMYRELDRLGLLNIMVARSAGKMVGYCLVVIRRHPHYQNICGFEDSYFVTQDYRHGWNGIRLIQRSIAELARRGVTVSYFATKEFNSIARIFEFLGLLRCDTMYCTGLGD